uniref:DarT domain-containing protein n=1 Tax=Candidatus Kentrum sp. DK TaxID=2126562 RepID=A0A450SJK8_9GAMM|nr:MAG: protein of unknown function (DUF4433) [Candidatus Kentron sp. DK]
MPHRVLELHNIMPIGNIPSVLKHGILSHEQATRLPHSDVSMADVQDRRNQVQVPGGMHLRQYANLYFHARNPMMFKRQAQAEDLCVLCVSTEVLNLPGVVLTDQNAASDYVRFSQPGDLSSLNFDWIYADDWRHPNDQIAYWQHKSAKCAEVLVPNTIHPNFIRKAYVVSDAARTALLATRFPKPVEIMPKLFFR